ncbi:GntR family transcriptional regulator [Streptacidiphilus sp. ASG 303]|uniref:GntR family transcriptional regulator n=1 Tax=Streptacidiphilus sp. ASG 303 TaxID=2896847 RepID=UPI001E297371|nr:GntR family transcriptional regulator [Streptacidiphilus sp. ASG 303]MCD0482137.1 GntR family transcriptional regulator [Streptacidiphilus sp. ASG 303]
MEITRNEPLYKQVAAVLRQAVADGEYLPGSLLPSEAQLSQRYRVSRPTVRQAIAALRTEGLVDVVNGKGSFVRARSGRPAPTVERTITRTDNHFSTPTDDWPEAEPPTVYRTQTDAVTGPLLGLESEEALIGCDRLITDPATGARTLHQTLVPFATADSTPLENTPEARPSEIYAILTAAGHDLTWRETVYARMPLPDERTALHLPEAVPLMVITRITYDASGQPLLLEESRTGGIHAAFGYAITAASDKRHAVRSR